MKRCSGKNGCGEMKPLSEFHSNGPHLAVKPYCRACASAYGRRWRDANPDYHRDYNTKRVRPIRDRLRHHLMTTYALTLDEYDSRIVTQSGRCAICSRDFMSGQNSVHVDHDHVSGVVRDILCGQCNPALGMFRDDPALLRDAATYIERHRRR